MNQIKKNKMTSPKWYIFDISRWDVCQEGGDIVARAGDDYCHVIIVLRGVTVPASCIKVYNGHDFINFEKLLSLYPGDIWEETRNVSYGD